MDDALSLAASTSSPEPEIISTSNGATSRNSNVSGIKLVLPSLSKLKAQRQPAKPPKLKPLKDVLSRLIASIKKKDDYAFFLEPVDTSQVPGYLDVIEKPMDFRTMTTKVQRGKYKSLDDFEADFRLVVSNAKKFNPRGTIYHSEAERIEAWGLDHIAKAAPTVIQYEADWNIDIENDDDANVNVEDDDSVIPTETATATVRDETPPLSAQFGGPRRSTRAPQKKQAEKEARTLSESIDAEGRLPGSKEGLGAFPPGSDWANMMLALKIKGKRYRSKKERLRIEKEGPPYRPDGSLDYQEMEDPFSVLSALVPDAPFRPKLTPVYSSTSTPMPKAPSYDPNTPRSSQTPQPTSVFPSPVNVYLPERRSKPEDTPKKHWTIIRNTSARTKGKEKEDDEPSEERRRNREFHATDFGSFAVLGGQLGNMDDEERLFDEIKYSLDCERDFDASQPQGQAGQGYWSTPRAAVAEEYLRDVVYGGVEGFAYVRSLAEFVDLDAKHNPYLAHWVVKNIVDPMTEGRHSLLRETALELLHRKRPSDSPDREDSKKRARTLPVSRQVALSLRTYPEIESFLALIKQIYTHQIDMASLIKRPEEFNESEEVWVGKKPKAEAVEGGENKRADLGRALEFTAELIAQLARSKVKDEETEDGDGEGEKLKLLRLNLLALSKFVPVDKLARLPRDLIPESVRHIVPVLP